ncbi:hypothetical protein [Helicobacter trogontum]|uniref:Uncharacterized protein n=2 Tax=Helicobacter trogontum TaxID=50960 RepID=A0A4U8SDX5_9HELI|nr:hypothetical protein [Helicobacter trogontum]TLD84334.1 hypothetical protein LS81_002405 [Helicobacter trogontum]
MYKTEMRRFLAVMEFCYGFLFGVALFGATLTFLITPDFFPAVLFAVCVFAFFIFLAAIVRYCIIRIKLADQMLQVALETRDLQEQCLQDKALQVIQHNE